MVIFKKYDNLELKESVIIDFLRRGKGRSKSKRKSVDEHILNTIRNLKEKAEPLISAKAVYQLYNSNELPHRICFQDAEKIALAIVTIGPNLPKKAKRLLDKGEYVNGVILDAIGSTGAEEVADYINEEINKVAFEEGSEHSRRFSPGYCQWDVADQKLIFSKLPAEQIGVRLSDSCMMVPIKSISFAVNFGKSISTSVWENRCAFCEIGDCSYRLE